MIATPALAQQSNWWGGSASGTGYPTNSTPIASSANGTTGAVIANLVGVPGKTTFICGFSMTSGGTTTAVALLATVAGVLGGPLEFAYVATAGGTQGSLFVIFAPICIPASAQNTTIVVTQPAAGTGTTQAAVAAWGYQL
jgi:hypothetical protein